MTCAAAPYFAIWTRDMDKGPACVTPILFSARVPQTSRGRRKASILLALRSLCCKIAVGGRHPSFQAGAGTANFPFSRKGVYLIPVRSRISG